MAPSQLDIEVEALLGPKLLESPYSRWSIKANLYAE